VLAVCARWETLCTVIGEVNDSGRLRVLNSDSVTADLPVGILVDDCPLYDLEPAPPTESLYAPPPIVLRREAEAPATLLALLSSANLASRRPVFEQYDPVVQSRTVRRPEEADAAVLALPDGSAIAVAIDGNGRRVACDPRRGAAEAVYECAANLACTGAEPLGLTNCLNFGNPEKPHVAWQLVESVEGIAQACTDLEVPVVGGNVSLYNEAPAGPIFPTPVIGMVGRLPDAARAGRLGFAGDGDAIALVGSLQGASPAGSELSKLRGEPITGPLPALDPEAIRATHGVVRDAVRAEALASAHDVAEGGLAVALAEACLAGSVRGIGAHVTLPDGVDPFGEAPGRAFVVSGEKSVLAALPGTTVIGHVGGDRLAIDGLLDIAVSELSDAWERGLLGFL
jgi:phosphoribosylformylglycinamidine (FGAM) synthase-like enzyme